MADHHSWGKRSEEALQTVHPQLAEICDRALEITPFDLIVTCGRRSKEDQEKAVREGRSKVHWPHGKHNVENPGDLARAVDIHPYPIDWNDLHRYAYLAGVMRAVAHENGIDLRWGGNFDRDSEIYEQRFLDAPHFEIVG